MQTLPAPHARAEGGPRSRLAQRRLEDEDQFDTVFNVLALKETLQNKNERKNGKTQMNQGKRTKNPPHTWNHSQAATAGAPSAQAHLSRRTELADIGTGRADPKSQTQASPLCALSWGRGNTDADRRRKAFE